MNPSSSSAKESTPEHQARQNPDHVIRFPWKRENSLVSVDSPGLDEDAKPGEYVLQSLFLQFCAVAEKKIDHVLAEPLEKPLARSLQRGEDPVLDQPSRHLRTLSKLAGQGPLGIPQRLIAEDSSLKQACQAYDVSEHCLNAMDCQILSSMACVAEQCLPSLLRTLFRWYERQTLMENVCLPRQRHKSQQGKDFLSERRDLAVEFLYCLVFIEVLSKLSYHPGHDDLIGKIISQAFRHFKYKDNLQSNPNSNNINLIADLYAEVIGVLAQSRFQPVRKTFLGELKELQLRDQTPYTAQSIISLLMGLKFFRIKLHPMEDFEACVSFLHDLGKYFLEVKDRDIKHSLAGIFVEILLPLSASAKNEVNVPVLKNFVEMLYSPTIDMTTKRKHQLHLFPLVTCLLCVSQKHFFLNNWPCFLTLCLSQLRNRDAKISRVALESLYRLLWVYMVRIKCESNTATHSRLQSIVNSLFPKGNKLVTPRDTPLNIFVKIIQFIAKERLDFAMREIIFDLLNVGRSTKNHNVTPERMSIGLRAFLVIADSLQQKDGDPPMPQSNTTLPSGSSVRVKRTFLNKMLTDTTAKMIGLAQYYPHILKTFDSILRDLDLQVGRPLLLTKSENMSKEPEELITGDRKPKIDLFRTSVAAIPRLTPDGMTSQELIELLTRLTVHVDEELKGLAFQALQNLIQDSAAWKEHVISGFVQFIQNDISDTNTQLMDSAVKMLMQLLVLWKTNCQPSINPKDKLSDIVMNNTPAVYPNLSVLHRVEGLVLVLFCSSRAITKKFGVMILKEVRNIFLNTKSGQVCDPCLIDVLDKASPAVAERLLPWIPASEKAIIFTSPNIDLHWLVERSSSVWPSSHQDSSSSTSNVSPQSPDPWIRCVAELVSREFAMTQCPLAVVHAWPIVYTRLNALFPLVDPSTQTNETRASILRSGSKKVTSEKDLHMQLWQRYVVLACTIAQKDTSAVLRCASPELGSSPESSGSDRAESRQTGTSTATSLFHLLVPLVKSDHIDMRDSIVNGLGYSNPAVFKELSEEMVPFLKEAIDKKADNVRKRRKRDTLRLQIAKIFQMMATRKSFADSDSGVIDGKEHTLSGMFVDYIDGARQYLEGENDRDLPILQDIRLHFSGFIRELILNTQIEYRKNILSRELRYSLFHLFANWGGQFCHTVSALDRRLSKEQICTEIELAAMRAMSAVLCCGPVFDPSGLNDDGYIYNWLDTLLSSHQGKIYELAKETVILLLDFNPETQGLLDWVIDRCYTGANEVADGCFRAICAVFQTREYPCDHVAMLNLAVLNVGNPRFEIHESALKLLHLLDTRFFQEEPVLDTDEEEKPEIPPLNDILISVSYSNSQIFLSEQLANLHPDLTMPMFSEITHRFQTAKSSIRHNLLKYLLPWLHNMELVDACIPPSNPLTSILIRLQENQSDPFRPPLKGDGWGSSQATEMVLNNLFYITVKYGDDHPKEVEALWTALVTCWPTNLKIIIRYMIIISNMAPNELLPFAKRVIMYLGRAKPEKLVDELMAELQAVETLNMNIERTQTPPFYRLSPMRRVPNTANTTDDEKLGHHATETQLEKGVLHTKRHSGNEEFQSDSTPRTNSTTSLRSVASTCSTNSVCLVTDASMQTLSSASTAEEDISHQIQLQPVNPGSQTQDAKRSDSPAPYPLPMPAYGGYFAPLTEFLPETLSPSPGFHRSNIAVMFLSDLVLDGLDIDWTPHLPLMLHVIFLGMDHTRYLVYEHCKKLLRNLLLLAAAQDSSNISRVLLNGRSNVVEHATTEQDNASVDTEATEEATAPSEVSQSTFSVDSTATITPDATDPDNIATLEQLLNVVVNFLELRPGKPMWCYEDITPKTLTTQSADQLSYFLKCVVRCFRELSPLACVEQRWSQVALQLALSCSSRHYAGRSYQILRALKIRPSTQMLSDILSRLVETVAEQGDDMQGYVTEIMLTLESFVEKIDLDFRPVDVMRELFMSTPNLAKDRDGKKGSKQHPPHHSRSTSYSVNSVVNQRMMAFSGDSRIRSISDTEGRKSNLPRSRSAQSLKYLEEGGSEDKLTIITQMFWIAVSLLESDYEYEFLLAVRLLEKILEHLQPEIPECREKLDKILQQIRWSQFPGVQTLLLKGCTSYVTAEATWSLLSRLTMSITAPVVDPSAALGLPMNVISLLPYLVHNYENPTDVCRTAADRIAKLCSQLTQRLDHLATVMSLYSHGTFNKDSLQWTKCVIKYLHDVYDVASLSMITFLVEVLEKGASCYQMSVLQILHCMVHYIDLNTNQSNILNSELFRSAVKHLDSSHWKEALKILKIAVARSSTLSAVPPTTTTFSASVDLMTSYRASFVESDIYAKVQKELPGRTLDFTLDVTQTPIIGRKFINPEFVKDSSDVNVANNSLSLQRKPSTNQSQECVENVWKRPHSSQSRTRDRLMHLLTCYGQKVGTLPKSPSVIFSQSSDTLDHQQSVGSSEDTSLPESNEALLNDNSGNYLMDTFKTFDFLDNELEESDQNDQDYFSLTQIHSDRRRSLNLDSADHSVSHRQQHSSSVPDLKLMTSVVEKMVSPSESVSVKEERSSVEEESDGSATEHDNDVLPRDLAASNTVILLNPHLDRHRHSSLSASVQSLHSQSNCSEVEIEVPSTAVALPNFSHLHATYISIQNDEVEDCWKSYMSNVMAEPSLANTVIPCQIFPRLYRELRRRLANLTKESCYYIVMTDSLRSIASELLQVIDVLFIRMDCPFLFAESDTLLGGRCLEKNRFLVLEIQESYETYCTRKDQAEQCLEKLKTTIKQQSLGDADNDAIAGNALCGEEQKIELCQKLYKLIFQLVLLFESYFKLLEVFKGSVSSPQVIDLSVQISAVREELSNSKSELDKGQVSPMNIDIKRVSKNEAIAGIVEYIQGHQHGKAIQLIRSFRSVWRNDIFGHTAEDDVTALLHVYCACIADKKTGVFVLTRPEIDFGQLYSHLSDIKVELSNLSPVAAPVRQEINIKSSDSSTL